MRLLGLVDFVGDDDKLIDGLVSVHQPEDSIGLHERAVLHEASAFLYVDYVFFRRYEAADDATLLSSHVAAYVIDNTRHGLDEAAIAEIHHKLWLHGIAPLVYVNWPTRIDILSCAREPDFWDTTGGTGRAAYRPAEQISAPSPTGTNNDAAVSAIKLAARISQKFEQNRRRFSGYRLSEGTFWDDPANRTLARHDFAAHRSLIRAVVEADRAIDGSAKPVRRRLLMLVILIKYLEDRGVFPVELFGRFHAGARSIRDILRDGTAEEVHRLLAYFERKFNGDVFSLGADAEQLTETEFRRFARLVAGNELGGQLHFWELYSFEHIPVEVISRLYQRFVTSRGAVYTPPQLASLLLDRVMPYEQMTGIEKVLDPACGSGVFLVGAFKRLVVHWRGQNDWRRPEVNDLKGILSHSIFGVELETTAVDLTAFSLALAVCDALEPPVIWQALKFDKLRGRNLREGDFFDPNTFAGDGARSWPSAFDVVVGNPPFDSELSEAAVASDAARERNLPSLPDKQTAYLFLEKGLQSLATGGSLCLIQPAGLIYNNNPVEFRRHLMRLRPLRSVLDFVSIRGMYEGADPKTIAWYASGEQDIQAVIHHLTFRRTYSAAEMIAFEIDHYDNHPIPRRSWKRIRMCGGKDFWEAAG
ncbi:N-6 DNA methylase [Limnoglobus roseus]|uniref:site-specific DNA-methyltransferase (adenine-specific) n=1 Tax=Limnoglobus roseus TaxID=2598579 RepID=A0A5C1AKZ2_9BACT|nr:N-6 DNA methylase [Limnoglobus roseus]QEL17568.1 type I restriction endonuclease subunit M [Limnoglobus roseus]